MGGETAIPYAALSQYARDYNIEGPDFDLFLTFMTAIDSEWLDHVVAEDAKQREADKK